VRCVRNSIRLRAQAPNCQVFVDYQDRFCFKYPPQYQVAPAVFAPGVPVALPHASSGASPRSHRRRLCAPYKMKRPRPSTHSLTGYPFDRKTSPDLRHPEMKIRRSLFMPYMETFITTVAVEVVWTIRTPFTSDFPVVHSRLFSMDCTSGATSLIQRQNELSQRFTQPSTHFDQHRACMLFLSDFGPDRR